MKTINIVFEDREYEALIQSKGDTNWHDFILLNCVDSHLKEGAESSEITPNDTPCSDAPSDDLKKEVEE